MRKFLIILLCTLGCQLHAQRISRQYDNVPMSSALKELNALQDKYTVNFIYDDLEDFKVTKRIQNKNVPDAIQQLIGFYPIRMTVKGNVILVECMQKTNNRYKGRIIDEEGQPVAYANIALLSVRDSAFAAGGVSNESGYFVIPCDMDRAIARITYVGYKTFYRPSHAKNFGICQLSQDSYSITGIVVKGERPTTSLKDGSLVTNVANTVLSKLSDMEELLQRIPGLLKVPGGKLEVIGGGTPEIYINKRKMTSYTELKQLSPQNIQSVEVINSPGAKYSAQTNAVVIIHTLRRDEGYWLETSLNQRYGFYPSYRWDAVLGIKQGKLSTSVYYNIDRQKQRVNQPVDETITAEHDIYHYIREQHDMRKGMTHNWQANLEYEISEHHQAGTEYDGTYRNGDSYRNTFLDYYKNNTLAKRADYTNHHKSTDHYHHLNFYHNGKWNHQLSTDFNFDYVYKDSPGSQDVTEHAPHENIITPSYSKSHYSVYSTRFNADWQASSRIRLSAGIDGSIVEGKGYLHFNDKVFDSSDYEQKESRAAVYASLRAGLGFYSLIGGLRYEMVDSRYKDNINTLANVNRTYHHVFPSLTVTRSKGEWTLSLGFTSQIMRPSFRQLSNCSYYMSEFMYQEGNPLLKPAQSYRLQWTMLHKWLTLYARFTHQKNYIDNGFRFLNDRPNVIVSTYNNYDGNKNIGFGAAARKNFGWYYGSLQADMNCPFFDMEYLGETIHYRKPRLTLVTSNIFTLPASFSIDLYYMYCSGGDRASITFSPYQNLNVSIKKSFLHNSLVVALTANDVFRTLKYTEDARIGRLHFHQTEDYQEWHFGMKITYRFNHRQNYKGKSSAQSEIDRL